jgi:predicted DCC family thiol-disulfide oxidoreductase YuxK
MHQHSPDRWVIEVFFDGDCPICTKEIALLRRWDKFQRIRFTNIAAPDFNADAVGFTFAELMAEIHGRLPSGEFVKGVEVFRRLYAAVGFGWLVGCSRLPGVSHLLAWGYRRFARNRLKWTDRCTSECRVGGIA